MTDRPLLRRVLPDAPRQRFSAYLGTDSPAEWWAAARDLVGLAPEDVPSIEAYEAAFAARVGCRHAVSFGAGRMAFFALLEALELRQGDEVLLPGLTCVSVPNALLYRGLVPVYADIDPVTFNLDPAQVERRIGPRTRVLSVQHSFGVSAPVAALADIARRRGLLLIEDAAHSLGATVGDALHGSLGHAAFFSTDRTKILNTQLGGMVSTGDEALADRLRAIQRRTPWLRRALARRILAGFLADGLLLHPRLLWLGRPVAGALRRAGCFWTLRDEDWQRLPEGYPYPHRLAAGQARIGSSALSRLDRNLAHRRQLAEFLEQRIGWFGAALPGPLRAQAWARYPFLISAREEFERRLSRRFHLHTWFTSVLYPRASDFEPLGYRPGSCPVAERCAASMANLPTHPRVPHWALQELCEEHGDWIAEHLVRA